MPCTFMTPPDKSTVVDKTAKDHIGILQTDLRQSLRSLEIPVFQAM